MTSEQKASAEEASNNNSTTAVEQKVCNPDGITYKDVSKRFDSVLELLKKVETEMSASASLASATSASASASASASRTTTSTVDSIKEQISKMKAQTHALKVEYGQLKWQELTTNTGYPSARRDAAIVDTYTNSGGEKVQVNDPYQWLEDPDSTESREWIYEQVRVCNAFLDSVCGNVSQIYAALEENINFPRYSTPNKKGNIYYYTYNSGLQNQSVLYFHCDSLDNKQQILIDPNTLSEDGTTALKGKYFSENGKYLCYGLSEKGSDWTEYRVKEVETGTDLSDHLKWCKFTGITWLKDSSGFFYSRYKAPKAHNNNNNDEPSAAAAEEKAAEADDGSTNADSPSKSKSKGTETEKLTNQMLFFHKLGTDQSADVFLIDGQTLGDVEFMSSAGITHDGNYLELYITKSCDPVNKLYLIDLRIPAVYKSAETFQSNLLKLIDTMESGFDVVFNVDTLFYFKTNQKASNYKVVSYDIKTFPKNTNANNDDENAAAAVVVFADVIVEQKFRLDAVQCVNNGQYLLLDYNEDVKTVLKLVNFQGEAVPNRMEFPAAGSIYWTGSAKHSEVFFYFTSFLYPGTIFTYDFDDADADADADANESGPAMKEWKAIEVPGFVAADYKTEQVFYESKDETKIPMYIISPKEMQLNGANPTILYGYGGFDISLMPSFRVTRVLWLKHTGGVYCVANLRGGGEYGETWHQAGTKDRKQNVFDDFHSAAQYLVDARYTSARRLAIEGGSNGGLLVTACLNQRPDLYRCGVANCGVLDMLKFHKFTIGYAWCGDYGCADVPAEFDALYKYSPLHNITYDGNKDQNRYPAVMTTTADHDDRVSPLHTFKFMAELQHQNPRNINPILTRIDVRSGHGSSSLTKGIEARADTFAFIAHCLNAEWK